MLGMGDIRRGLCIKLEGRLMRVIDFQRDKVANRRATTWTKLKDINTGQVLERTFRGSDQIEEISLATKEMQLLYSDQSGYHFMDQETFEQVVMTAEQLGDSVNYIMPEDVIKVECHEENPIGVELPASMLLTVVESPPAVKGNTATGATKVAKLSTGFEVKVPLFIVEGERIKIDTRSGEFLGRA